jgi:hypothetical protein
MREIIAFDDREEVDDLDEGVEGIEGEVRDLEGDKTLSKVFFP